jgi:hypothetical protein
MYAALVVKMVARVAFPAPVAIAAIASASDHIIAPMVGLADGSG